MAADTTIEELPVNIEGLPHGPMLKEMVDTGVFFGRKKNKTNPKMKPFIFGNRGGIEIIDLNKTIEGLEAAKEFLREKVKAGGVALLVATQPSATGVVALAKEHNLPLVDKRWIGGTLTNFKTIAKRIEHFKKLKADMASGVLSKYTKKERLNIEREIDRLRELIGGLEVMDRLPDVLVVVDPTLHTTAIREARRVGIPVLAFANTDADPDAIDYLIPGNTAARKSVDWFFEKIGEVIKETGREIVSEAKKAETEHGG